MNWIDINVRTPDPHEKVLMVDCFKEIYYGTFELSVNGLCHWINDCDEGTLIKYWMEIPEPPEAKEA